ncbi:MAG: response regulator [Deltaproteobacteria bacterium]|nr:response regulator [Deltaproteobacteria bacterium]
MAAASEPHPLSLLLVEDDGAIRTTFADLLTDEGYAVVAVGDLRSAIVALRRQPVTAAVLDWKLENETAEPLLQHLAREGAATAVVLVSAAREAAAIASRFRVPFLRKPLDLTELTNTIGHAIRAGLTPQQQPPPQRS